MANFLTGHGNIFPTPEQAMSGADENLRRNGLPIGSGILGEVLGRTSASAADVLGSGATFAGLPKTADFLHSYGNYVNARLPRLKELGDEGYWTSTNGLLGNVANVVGSQAALLLPTLPFGGAFGAGARALTTLPKLGRFINPKVAQWAMQNAASSFGEGAVEGGNYIENAIMRGEDPEVARQKAWDVARNNLAFLSTTNAAEGGLAASIFNNKNSWKNRLASAAANALIQTYEEGGQRGIQLDAEGKPYTFNPIEMMTNPKYAEQYKEMKETIAPLSAMGLGGFLLGSVVGRNQNNNPPPSQDTPPESENQTPMTTSVLAKYATPYEGKKMDNGVVGCVEAVRKIGSGFSDFLREESNKNVNSVARLRDDADAKGLLVPYDENNLQAGDILGWKSNGHSHVVIYDGNGGYWGNSSYADDNGGYIVHSDKPHNYGKPDWIIKTGGRISGQSSTQSQTQQPTTQQGNIFGVNDYNMPTQGDRITQQVSQLKNGWQQVIPQIGGVLKDKFGINATISSAARTADHNANVGGVPTSHHIIRENGGDALDIVFDRETSQAEQDKIANYFKNSGLFKEVLYHDVGSGAHLHLGGLQSENISSSQTSKRNTTATQNDPNFSEKENKLWRFAQKMSDYLYSKTNFRISPEMFYRQWMYESDNATSKLAKLDHNYGGLTYYKVPTLEEIKAYDPNFDDEGKGIESLRQPKEDGNGYYRHYKSDEDYFQSYIDDFVIPRIKRGELTADDVKTVESYATAMKNSGYFGGELQNYISGMNSKKIPNTQGYSESDEDVSDSAETEIDSEQPQIERDTSNDELIRSLLESNDTEFKIEDENPINQQFIQDYVQDKLENGTAEEIANLGEILQNFYNDNGEFQNTKENRQALANALGEDNLKNLGQENLNSKIADYKNFLQTRINPLQEEVSKLEEKHKKALENFDNYKKMEGDELDNEVLKSLRKNIIDSKKELDNKISELNGAQKILNPEVQETQSVEKFTATLNENAKTKPTDKNLLNMLELDETPQFNPLSKNAVTRNIIEDFIKQKISSTQDKSLRKFLNADNKLISNQATRQKISTQFGAELQDFGQSELDKRLEELKSRYKIERPAQRESVDVLPETPQEQSEENQQATSLKELQSQLDALNKAKAQETKNAERALNSNDNAAFANANENLKNLNQQIADKNAEIENFKQTPEHLQELKGNLENLLNQRTQLDAFISANGENKKLLQTKQKLNYDIFELSNELEERANPAENIDEKAQDIFSDIKNDFGEDSIKNLKVLGKFKFEITIDTLQLDDGNYLPVGSVISVKGDNEQHIFEKALQANETDYKVFDAIKEKANSAADQSGRAYVGYADSVNNDGLLIAYPSAAEARVFVRTMELLQNEIESSAPQKETVDLLAELRDLEKQQNTLNKEWDKATNARNYQQADELEKQIEELNKKIQSKQAEFEEFKKNPKYLESLKDDLKDNEEHLKRLNRLPETPTRKKRIKETKQTISRLENEIDEFEKPESTVEEQENNSAVTSKYLQDIPSGNMNDLFDEEQRREGEQAAREKMLAENEKTESQKIYERGEQRAKEKFQQENSELEEVEENNSVEENNFESQETAQQEKTQTQSQEEFDSRQEKNHENKPSIYREGNKFIVHVGEDVSNAKLMLFGTFLKKYNGKYRRGTKTFEFPKASAAMSFATNVEITKFDDDARQEMYRKARVADFPVLKYIFDAGFDNPQAVDTLKYLQSLPTKQLARISTEALLNNYKGDDAKFKKAQNLLNKMLEGKIQTTPTDAYNKVFDMLYGEETENGETLPALNPPQQLLNFGDENISESQNKPAENERATDSELSPKDKVKQKLLSLAGKPITNKETGIVAFINVTQINEMLSNRAVSKSTNNGFTQAQHLKATENIKQLYEDATLSGTHPDRKKKQGSQGLKSIKIFHCDTEVLGEDAVAKLTVKESFQHGHRIYSIELEELNKPTALENRTENDSAVGSEDSTQKGNVSSSRYAEEPSAETIPQSAKGDKKKTLTDKEIEQKATELLHAEKLDTEVAKNAFKIFFDQPHLIGDGLPPRLNISLAENDFAVTIPPHKSAKKEKAKQEVKLERLAKKINGEYRDSVFYFKSLNNARIFAKAISILDNNYKIYEDLRTAEQIRYDQSPESLTAEERKFYEHLKKVQDRRGKSRMASNYLYLNDNELVRQAKKVAKHYKENGIKFDPDSEWKSFERRIVAEEEDYERELNSLENEEDFEEEIQEEKPQTKKATAKVTGDEFGKYKNIKELRQKAIQYYKDHLQGTSVENKTLGKIDIDENGLVEFTGEGRSKVKSNSAQEDTLLLIKHLPELIKTAEDITHKESESEKHKKVGDSFYYLETEYNKNDKIIPVTITLKKLHTGDIHYYNHVIGIKKDVSVTSGTESSNEANVSPTVNTSSTDNIPQSAKGDKEKTLTDKEIEQKATELLKNLKLNPHSAPASYISSINISNIRDGFVTDKIYVNLGCNDYKKVWNAIDKIAGKTNAEIDSHDNREHHYSLKNLDDARIFAKAVQNLLRGVDGEEIKIYEDLPTAEELKTQNKVFDEMKQVGREKKAEREKLGEPVRNIKEDTIELPQKRGGVHYVFPKVKTADKTWFYYPDTNEFYDYETQDMYKPADESLQNALEYFYNYGDAEKAIQAMDYELKYDDWTAKYLSKLFEKSKKILSQEGQNWQAISPSEDYFEEEIQEETPQTKKAHADEQDTSKAVSVEENISNGKKAIREVLETQKDVKSAMYRDDIGNIDFVYGTPGKGEKFKKGYGISHIVAKRNAENGKGLETANKLVEVIAKGTDTDKQQSEGSNEYRLRIHYDDYTAVLSSPSGERNAWLLTGWENNKETLSSVTDEGNGSNGTTADAPMLTRRAEEDNVSAENIPQRETQGKSDAESLWYKVSTLVDDLFVLHITDQNFTREKIVNAVRRAVGKENYLKIEEFVERAIEISRRSASAEMFIRRAKQHSKAYNKQTVEVDKKLLLEELENQSKKAGTGEQKTLTADELLHAKKLDIDKLYNDGRNIRQLKSNDPEKYRRHQEDIETFIHQTFKPLDNGAEIKVSPQWNNSHWHRLNESRAIWLYHNNPPDMFESFDLHLGDFKVAEYETEPQALDALQELRRAIERGDSEFQFPSVEKIKSQTKKANTGEQDTSKAELAEGYKTESGRSLQDADRDEFILKPDGSKDFGQITAEVVEQSQGRLKKMPIRLQVGFNRLLDNGTYKGFGLLHIKKREESLKKLGYDSAENYLETIAQNYDRIYDISTETKPNRFLITMHDEHYNVMPVDFIATSDGKSYTIVSALSKGLNRENKQKGTVLFDRSASLSSTSNSETAQNGNVSKNVGTDTQSATEKVNVPSAETIAQKEDSDKEISEQQKDSFTDEKLATAEESAKARQQDRDKKEKLYKEYRVDKFPVLKNLIDNDKIELVEEPSEEELLISALGALDNKYPIGKSPLTKEYETQYKNRNAERDKLLKEYRREGNPISAEQAYQNFENFLQQGNGKKEVDEQIVSENETKKYPDKIKNSPARKALYDYLDGDEELAIAVDKTIMSSIEPDWEKNFQKRHKVNVSLINFFLDKGYSMEDSEKMGDNIFEKIFKTQPKYSTDFLMGRVILNERGELEESGRTDGGHQVRESELRTETDEGTRSERRDKISERVSRQERQAETGTGETNSVTNAENARPDEVQSAGTSSARVSAGNGTGRSAATVQSDDGTERGRSGVSANAENVEFSGHNFKITDDSDIGEGNLKTKFKQNIDAIKLLKQLESEGRKATPSEQEILSKFNGWGTLASAFTNKDDWKKQSEQLKEILTDEEYDKASKVSTNAFYTSPKIAKVMWQGLEKLGFKGGRILDPATGSGIFFGTMPSEIMANSELTGVEYDNLTGRLAQQLYQKAAIDITPYQNRLMPNNYYDLAITNVPFEELRIYADKNYSKQAYMLHNFYFAKTIDKVRPGGLVAFITSQGTMRSKSAEAKKLRAELNGKADLIAAFKLPNTAFKDNAGTEVTTDILILQKRLDQKKPSPYAQKWNELEEIYAERHFDGGSFSVKIGVNEYFETHPENMIGKPIAATTQRYGEYQLALDGKNLDVAKELEKLIENLPENIYTPVQHKTQDTLKNTFAAMADATQREGTFSIKDNKVVQNIDGKLVEVPKRITVNRNKKQVEIDNPAIPVIKDFITLQKTLDNVLKAQLSPETTDAKLSELRERLNKNYDNFVKNHGYLNAPKNRKFLEDDPNYGKVAAIEKYKEDKKNRTVSASKADIFYRRTASPLREVNSADNALDALRLSLSRHGKIDTDYMSKLTGKNLEELTKELGDLVYKNPETNLLELAEEYLSGNVREKLFYARESAKHNPEFKRNVEALEKVLPVDLTDKEIFPHMGANWIDEKYYYDFIKDLVGESENVHITRDKFIGKWKVSGWIPHDKNIQWRIAKTRQDFITLFEGALNHRYPNITSNKIQLKEQMAEAKDKIDKITEEFDKWIFADEKRKADLVKTYNEKYNSEVERRYDGSHLELPGLNEEVKNKLYPHQKDAIWRVLQGKNTLLAHCVGAGKTWEMVISAMEMKRIGMINKPLFTVPNNIVEQFAREFRIAYPNANLLVLTSNQLGAFKSEDSKETKLERMTRLNNRRKTLSRIVTEDWDGIIISHNLFERLPMSKEGLRQYSRDGEKIDRAEIIQMTAESKDDIKDSVKAIKAAEERIEKKYNLDTNEIIMPFEELGIDQIFVDESDMFKNLGFETSNYNPSDPNPDNRVVGVSTANAQRAQDLYTKARWLSAQRNGGGLVFASGTPVSNTLNEIYTIQRYLDPEMLAENGWKSFDEWANHFGKTVETTEADAAGNYVTKRRLNLNNLPALIHSFRKIADIKMFEDLPHLQENVPKLKGGERRIITIEPTDAFNEYREVLLERNETLHKARTKEERGDDNFLKIAGDFRKASLDMRLIDPSYSEEEAGGKINAVCDNIFAKFEETTDAKGTQLVFLDLSTPKAKKIKANGEEMSDEESALGEETSKDEATVYDRIKRGLVKRGIPASQIAFVHEAKNASQRQALFDKVNEGDIRVIIGSTAKMGAGTNFQKHLVALHHVDCPWRPRDIEQREGRILRAGNLNKEVEIFTYVTKGSYDSINWALVTRKQNMIDSLMRGDPTVTEVEDVSDIGASYSDIAAAGEDNPLAKELHEVEGKVLRLKSSQKRFLKNQNEGQLRAARLRQNEIPALERSIKNLQADIKNLPNLTGDNFKMKLGDKVYTKFGEASKAFDKFMHDFKNLSLTKIGEIGGFNIKARIENIDSFDIETFIHLEKNGSYRVRNSLDSIRNFISGKSSTSIVERLEMTKVHLDYLKTELAGLDEKLQEPFDKQEELNAAEERLAEIQSQLKGSETSESSQQNSSAENISDNEPAETSEVETPKAETVADKNKKTFAELSGYRGLSRKQDKNGNDIYYLGNKRISSYDAINMFRDQLKEKQEVLIDELKNATGFNITLQRLGEKPSLSFGNESIDGGIWYTHLKFDNLQEAITTARYIFKNYANFIAENDKESFIAVYDDDGENFSINRNGEEKFYTDKAKKIVAEVDNEPAENKNVADNSVKKIAEEINSEFGTNFTNSDKSLEKIMRYFKAKENFVNVAKENEAPTFHFFYDAWIDDFLFDNFYESDEEFENFITSREDAYNSLKEKMFPLIYQSLISETVDKNSTVKVTGKEFGDYSDIKELRQKAIQYYKDHLQGTSVENKTLGKIDIDENGLVEFTTAGRKKVESTSAQEQKLLIVKYLPNLIENATDIEKAEPVKERHKDDIFYYLHTSAEINGENVPVHITLVKHNTRRIQFYNHSVEKEDTLVNSATPNNVGNSPVSVSSTENIPQSEENGKEKQLADKNGSKITLFEGFLGTIKSEKGKALAKEILNREVNYNGKTETRREHIEHIALKNPEWLAEIVIPKKGTKDIYGVLNKDQRIMHGTISRLDFYEENGRFPTTEELPFEFVTLQEYRYFKFLQDPQKAIKEFEEKNAPKQRKQFQKFHKNYGNDENLEKDYDGNFDDAKRLIYNAPSGTKIINSKSDIFVRQYKGKRSLQYPIKSNSKYKAPLTQRLLDFLFDGESEIEIVFPENPFKTSDDTKFAGRGELTEMFENARQLSDSELNSRQKKWQDFGAELGLKVVWIDAHKDLKGAVEGGTIYLNAKNNKNISKTFYHEQFHILSALNPELHDEMFEHFREKFSAEQLDAYRKENQREDLTDDEVIEEILCDNFEDVQRRVKILQEMSKDNPNLLKKFIAYLKNLADKFVSVFRSPEGGMTREQRDAFIQKFNALAGSLEDIHGNKIFTTYKGGKDLKFANGENLPNMELKFESEIGENTAELEKLRKKYQGTDKWLKAPNGENTNLTEKQWLTVRTKAFKRWFGDWENDRANSSQVVDENGEPLVVYHGARKAGFSIFNDTEGKKQSDAPEGSSFFSNSRELAQSYSGTADFVAKYGEEAFEENDGGNYACFLNIRNPFVDNFEGSDWQGDAYGKFQILDEDDIPVYNSKGRELFDSEDDAEEYAQELELENYSINADPWIGKSTNSVVREVMQGEYGDDYDGVIIEEVVDSGGRMDMYDPATEYIIFNSNQVKSATDNIGEFNPFDDDIRFSYSGTTTKNSVDNASKNTDNTIDGKLFTRYVGKRQQDLKDSLSVDVAVARREGKNIVRDELPTINRLIDTLNATPKTDAYRINREMYAAQIEFVRRYFENEFGRNANSVNENNRSNSSDRRGATSFNDKLQRNTKGESTGTVEKVGSTRETILNVDGEKDDAKKLWREMYDAEKTRQDRINASHSENRSGFSIDEKVSAALADDPTKKILIENLGGKIVNGKLVADAKTKAKIESQLDNNGKVKYSGV